MIFRLEGTVRNLLALTPVLREWKTRGLGEVFVETDFPEIMNGNPHVDGAAKGIGRDDSDFFDMDQIRWQEKERHVTETYAESVLGDTFLESWRMFMAHGHEDSVLADAWMSGRGKVAILGLGVMTIAGSLEKMGYEPVSLSHVECCSWGRFRAIVERAALYVGEAGDESSVALTTDVPAVVVYRRENPEYFAPFRKFPTFEPVTPPGKVCDVVMTCLSQNGIHEFGRTLGLRCPKERKMACDEWDCSEAVIEAVAKVTMKVNRETR